MLYTLLAHSQKMSNYGRKLSQTPLDVSVCKLALIIVVHNFKQGSFSTLKWGRSFNGRWHGFHWNLVNERNLPYHRAMMTFKHFHLVLQVHSDPAGVISTPGFFPSREAKRYQSWTLDSWRFNCVQIHKGYSGWKLCWHWLYKSLSLSICLLWEFIQDLLHIEWRHYIMFFYL